MRSVDLESNAFSGQLRDRLAASQAWPRPGSIQLYWLGQAGFVIESGRYRLAIDPYLSDSLARKYRGTSYDHVRMMPAPIEPVDLIGLDAVLCTHRHTDHMDPDTLQSLALGQPSLRFVVPAASADEAARRCAVTPERLLLAHAGMPIRLAPSVTITPLPSAHETFSVDAAGDHEWLGYVIDMDGLRLYHSGDCVPYPGLSELLSEYAIDVALLPVNGRDEARRAASIPGNFTLDEAIDLCCCARIPHLVAHHYGLFAFNTIAATQIDARAAHESGVRVVRAVAGYALTVAKRPAIP